MKNLKNQRGFTLMETIIALGVMTVLVTGFLAVFGPATGSIRRALSVEEANRLQSSLEREMAILRPGTGASDDPQLHGTSFEKAFSWVKESHNPQELVILYKYKGDPRVSRGDGTLQPFSGAGEAGQDFLVQPMARRKSDPLLAADFEAITGRAYFVTMTQLVKDGASGLKVGKSGEIVDPQTGTVAPTAGDYRDAVIAFEASFYQLPTVSISFLNQIDAEFLGDFANNPSFTRNLGVRR